jgi:hypothetical protein
MVIYDIGAKTARMTATRNHFAGGSLEILDAKGTVLARIPISREGGTVARDKWTIQFDGSAGNPPLGIALGSAKTARIKTSSGSSDLTGLTVGMRDSKAVTIDSGIIQHS